MTERQDKKGWNKPADCRLDPLNEGSLPRVSFKTWSPNSGGQEWAQMEPCGLIHAVTRLIATLTECIFTSHLHMCAHEQYRSWFCSTCMHPLRPTPSWGATSAEDESQSLQWENWSAIWCFRTPQVSTESLISFFCTQHHLRSLAEHWEGISSLCCFWKTNILNVQPYLMPPTQIFWTPCWEGFQLWCGWFYNCNIYFGKCAGMVLFAALCNRIL